MMVKADKLVCCTGRLGPPILQDCGSHTVQHHPQGIVHRQTSLAKALLTGYTFPAIHHNNSDEKTLDCNVTDLMTIQCGYLLSSPAAGPFQRDQSSNQRQVLQTINWLIGGHREMKIMTEEGLIKSCCHVRSLICKRRQ